MSKVLELINTGNVSFNKNNVNTTNNNKTNNNKTDNNLLLIKMRSIIECLKINIPIEEPNVDDSMVNLTEEEILLTNFKAQI